MGAETVSHQKILDVLNGLVATVGHERLEPGTGQVVATGVFARLRAIEARDHQDEINRLRWKNRILGVTLTAGFIASLFWAALNWVAGDRLDNAQELIRKAPAAEQRK